MKAGGAAATSPSSKLPTKEIDQNLYLYNTLDSRLGSGAFGAVYKGLYIADDGTEQDVAIKVFNNKAFRDKEIEAELMKKLDCPQIVRVIKTGYSNVHGFYIAMELCETTLKGFLQRQGIKKFSEREACPFFKDICLGIKYLQEHNILHRDLKLDNIMIDHDLHIKIGDFGLAKLIESDLTNTTCGSTHIMAPEILKRMPYGKESDIWSLGVLLFGMLTGEECLYKNVNRAQYEELVKNFKEVIFPSHTELSREARDLISKMLVLDPRKRLTIDQILVHPWIKMYMKEDDLLSSNIVLQNYIISGEATKRLKVQLQEYWNVKLSSTILPSLVETLSKIQLICDQLAIARSKGFTDKQSVAILAKCFIVLNQILVKVAQGGKVLDLSKMLETKKQQQAIALIQNIKMQLSQLKPKPITPAQINETFRKEIVSLTKEYSCNQNPALELEVLKLLKLCFELLKIPIGNFSVDFDMQLDAVEKYAEKYYVDKNTLIAQLEEFKTQYVFTPIKEETLVLGSETNPEAAGMLVPRITPKDTLPERLISNIEVTVSNFDQRLLELK